MENKQLIFESLATLEKYFGKILEPEIRKIYVENLDWLEEDQFKAAMVRIMKEFQPTSTKPFPLVADILALCGEDADTKAINIVSMVKKAAEKVGQYQSVDFGDRALHGVIQRFGGWPAVVLWSDKDWQLNERNFISAYKAAVLSGFGGPCRVIGLHEEQNLISGHTVKPPVLIGNKPTPQIEAPKKKPGSEPTNISDVLKGMGVV